MKVEKKKGWGREKFIIRLPSTECTLEDRLSEILGSLERLSRLSKLSYFLHKGFDYLSKMVIATEKLFTDLSNIKITATELPSSIYLSEGEQERLKKQSQEIIDLLYNVLSQLEEMVRTTPERIPEAEAQKPEASAPPEE